MDRPALPPARVTAALAAGIIGLPLALTAWHGGQEALVYDTGGVIATLPLHWSVDQVLAGFAGPHIGAYEGADLASYLEATLRLRRHRELDETFATSWPPGIPLLATLVTGLTGDSAYPRKMITAAALLWGAALLFSVWALFGLEERRRSALGAGLSVLFLLSPGLATFVFGFGSLMTEGVSNAFFLAACAALLAGARRPDRRGWFVAAGVLCGLATLVRIYFEFVSTALLLGPAAVAGAGALLRSRRAALLPFARRFLLAFAVFHLTVLPWRLYKQLRFQRIELYSAPRSYALKILWYTDAQLPLFVHGANPACHAAPDLCARVQAENFAKPKPGIDGAELEALTRRAFLRSPLGWYRVKLRDLDWLWFNGEWDQLWGAGRAEAWEGLAQLAVWSTSLLYLAWSCARRPTPPRLTLLLLAGCFLAANFLIFSRLHFEGRYSVTLKLFALSLPLWLLAVRTEAPLSAAGEPGRTG